MRPATTRHAYDVLRRRILMTMIMVPAVPFLLALAVGVHHFNTAVRDATLQRVVRIAEDHRDAIQAFLDERRADLEFIAASWSFDELAAEDSLAAVLDGLQRTSPAFVDLGVFNADGVHVAYEGPYQLTGRVYREAEWFRHVLERGHDISDVFLGFRNSPHFVVAIASGEGAERWVLRATIDTALFNRLVEGVRIGRTGEAYVLNRAGVFQTERRSGGELMETAPEDIGLGEGGDGVVTAVSRDAAGVRYVWATTRLNDGNWLLVVRQDVADAFSPLHRATYIGLLILVGGGAVIVLLAVSFSNRLIRRIQRADAETRDLNQQLIVASRLAEIGEMSAGFAHEINNPLQIIRSEQALAETIIRDLRASGALAESADVADLEDSIQQIRVQIDRCASVTQGILKFARRTESSAREVRLAEFVPEVAAMVSRKAAVAGIRLAVDVGRDAPVVTADPAQLQQVILNLVNNAFDAVEARHGVEGGEVGIGVARADGRAEITVRDNGTGISAADLDKIFTPFFTTKPVGKGTGLGLSVCFGIVESMGGTIRVASQENTGTTFTVSLAAAQREKELEARS
ncbi:MAG TPA: ATP-binding protein [Chondromyces sp.]|nr:ATP-binding protein [Chondromyces sp.]